MKINDLQDVPVGQQQNGPRVQNTGSHKRGLEEGRAAGRLAHSSPGNLVGLGVASSGLGGAWRRKSGGSPQHPSATIELGSGRAPRGSSLLPTPLSVPHSYGQGEVSLVALKGEAGR